MHLADFEPNVPHPRYWRIAACAAMFGTTSRHLEAAIERGEIPVELRRVGGLIFLHAEQWKAWFDGANTHDLFAGDSRAAA